jgi:hypothetical protein
MVVSTKIVKNEQHKLAATFFNNIAIGCVLLGLIGPLATGRYSHFLTLESLLPRPSGRSAGREMGERPTRSQPYPDGTRRVHVGWLFCTLSAPHAQDLCRTSCTAFRGAVENCS